MKINRILAAADFSETADKAIKQAMIFSKKFDAELVVLHARILYDDDPSKLPDELEALKKEELENENKLLSCVEECTKDFRHAGLSHKIIRGYSAHSAILRYLTENEFDLVVIGTHGRSGLGHFFMGSVAEKIVRYSPFPVLTVSQQTQIEQNFSRIIVPFDYSEQAIEALQTALELTAIGGEVDLVYVIDKDVHPAHYAWGMKSIMELVPDIIVKAEREMEQILAGLGNPNDVKITKHILEGKPAKELAGFINRTDCNLVAASTHGLVGLDRFLLGSTTEQLIRSVHKPVLTLKQKSLI
jgi:nucleotide-binding universal stress UspA family protein